MRSAGKGQERGAHGEAYGQEGQARIKCHRGMRHGGMAQQKNSNKAHQERSASRGKSMVRHFPERVLHSQMDEYGKRKEDCGNEAKTENSSNHAQDIKKGTQGAYVSSR